MPGEDQVLERRLERTLVFAGVSDHRVQRDTQGLEPEEERSKVRALHEHDRPEGRNQNQQIQLLPLLVRALHIVVAEDHHRERRGNHQPGEEQPERVYRQQRRDLPGRELRGDRNGSERQREPNPAPSSQAASMSGYDKIAIESIT